MRALRTPVLLALVLLVCADTQWAPTRVPTHSCFLQLLVDKLGHVKEIPAQEPKRFPRRAETQEPPGNKPHSGEKALDMFPRDLRQKEKFLRVLTGPLYFSPKCSKLFYRLYHNTRDCTIPAYYRRCARLLTRLAGSQRCMEG